MASEEPESTTPAAAAAPDAEAVPAEAEAPTAAAGDAPAADAPAAVSGGGDNKKNANNRPRKEEVPVEELYDISKPIPRVDRPDRAAHDKAVQEIADAVEKAKDDRRKLQLKIDEAMNDPEQRATLQAARNELNVLKTQKNLLINDKKDLRKQLDAARDLSDRINKEKKEARSNLRFGSLDEIGVEVRRLNRLQETTTMSLTEEKKIIKEIDALEKSKKYVADLEAKDQAMDDVREQRKAIMSQITAKDKDIDALNGSLDAVMETIRSANEVDSKKRDGVQELFKRRDAYKQSIGELLKTKDKLRDEFRDSNNSWYNYQRAVRAQKKVAYDEEKKRRDEEKAEYLRLVEEEEAKKIPYEEEQALCDYLANYLERTYLGGGSKEKDEETTAKAEAEAVVAVKDDPFAGFKPSSKKADDDEDAYFSKGKSKKKRVRDGKKQGGGGSGGGGGPFTVSVDAFEQFGLLQLNPPTSADQVEKSVAALREKKEWYKQQPRGSVPTAAEIRKASEKAAAKMRGGGGGRHSSATSGGGGENGESGNKPNKGGSNANKKFSLDNDDFAPLGGGSGGGTGTTGPADTTTTTTTTTTPLTSSWGQKAASTSGPSAAAAATAAVARSDPSPAEAAAAAANARG